MSCSTTSKHRSFASLFACMASAAIIFTGCGGSEGYSGPTGTVSGTLSLDEKPIAGNISFINSTDGFTASGAADSSGSFSLMSNGSMEIPVGKYQVAVTAAPGQEISPEAAMQASVENPDGDGSVDSATPDSTIPGKYSSPGGSGLSFEVTEGSNSFEVKLTSE